MTVHRHRAQRFGGRDRLHLPGAVGEHEPCHLAGRLGERVRAPLGTQRTAGHEVVEEDLQVDLPVREVHPGRVVDEIGVQPPPRRAYSIRPRCVSPRLPPSATHATAQLPAVDPDAVGGPVTNLGGAFARPLDEGADAAVPQQVAGARRIAWINRAGGSSAASTSRESRI